MERVIKLPKSFVHIAEQFITDAGSNVVSNARKGNKDAKFLYAWLTLVAGKDPSKLGFRFRKVSPIDPFKNRDITVEVVIR